MASRQASPTVILLLCCLASFLVTLAVYMLGPLLVPLAQTFQTSVAVVGQLATATAIPWGITAPLVGPVADAHGPRRLLLVGLLLLTVGLLGALLAWHYSVLLALRLLTGVGAGIVGPTILAAIADHFPPARRGQAMGWLVSAMGLGAAVGVPLVAALVGVGGWRLPFTVVGTLALGLWLGVWGGFPRRPPSPRPPLAFFAHYREVGSQAMVWYVLGVNLCQQMVFFGMFGYLSAYLMQIYHLPPAATALPLALAGIGVMVGGFLGGRVADHPRRVVLYAWSCWGSGLLAALVFTVPVSPWGTVALAGGAAMLVRVSFAVAPVVLLEVAGQARATATGLFAVSNQLGVFGGASLGGLLLAVGGFPLVGCFCLGGSVLAAAVVHLKVRDAAAMRAPRAFRQGTTAMD
jgi:MFS transporter, DHA1 family, inner membrane transport protein